MDPERVADVCPECGWLPDRSADEIWKKGVRNGRSRWRLISAMVVCFVAAVFVGQGVWRGTATTMVLKPHPWQTTGTLVVVQFGAQHEGQVSEDEPILMGKEFIAIAEGKASGEQLRDLLTSVAEMESEFAGGAVLYAAFGNKGVAEITTRQGGWPITWRRENSVHSYPDFRSRENESVAPEWPLAPRVMYDTRIFYDVMRGSEHRNVIWNIAGPPATILSAVFGCAVLGFVLKRAGRSWSPDRLWRVRRTSYCAVFVLVLLANVLSLSEATRWQITVFGRPLTNGPSSNPLITVPQEETFALARNGSDPVEIAKAVLAHSDSKPQPEQVVHLQLASPEDIEQHITSESLGKPLPIVSLGTTQYVRQFAQKRAEPIPAPPAKGFGFYDDWTSLTYQYRLADGRLQRISLSLANLSVIVFPLWILYGLVTVCGRGWVRLRTRRRLRRQLCTHCSYAMSDVSPS